MNRSRLLTIALALPIACVAPQAASAAYGDLDADFGVNGTIGNLKIANPSAVLIQQDRKILVAGGGPLTPYAGTIARVNRDGSPDETFGVNGFLTTPGSGQIYSVKLLGDQRIAALCDGNRIMVFNPDGKLDTGFGTAGVLSLGPPNTGFTVAAIEPQLGSKLLISGTQGGEPIGLRVKRLDRHGDVDPSFGDAGVATMPLANAGGPGLASMATAPNGDILVGFGSTHTVNAGSTGLVVVKFTATGQRVLDFGANGVAMDPNQNNTPAKQIVVARDGSFVALNKTLNSSGGRGGSWNSHAWAFYNAAGELQAGYPSRWAVYGAAPVEGPGFVVGFERNVSLVKPDATFDSRFARNGNSHVTVGACSSWEQLATDVDGSIVAAGSCNLFGGTSQLARFLGPDGGLPAPRPRIYGLSWSKKFHEKPIHRSWPRVLSGEAMPGEGLRRVGVAVRRVDGHLPKKGLCGWLINSGKQYSRSRKCSTPVFMKAKGRKDWRFDFGRPLAPGKYELYVRAYTNDGRFNPINDDAETFMNFTVKRPAKKK